MRAGLAGLILGAGVAFQAAAHPHVFVDTRLDVVFDTAGRAEGVRISWTYDDLFSLVIIMDHEMDADFDGVLTAQELETLRGFDMNWIAGYPGDTYALLGTAPLALSGPSEWSVSYADARITSVHYRRFGAPTDLDETPLVVKVYDPTLYNGYTIIGEPTVTGRTDCTAEVVKPDRTAADLVLQTALDAMVNNIDVEAEFPAVGEAYSEEARITCAARS